MTVDKDCQSFVIYIKGNAIQLYSKVFGLKMGKKHKRGHGCGGRGDGEGVASCF